MTNVALTMIGDDRPGLVSELASVLADHRGNWLESQMARLAGKFAGLVLVDVPDDCLADFRRALAALSGSALDITASVTEATVPPGAHLRLQIVGNDQPGIVAQATRALAAVEVSIERLTTVTSEAPMVGGLLFHADALIRLPDGVAADDVRSALEPLAGELMVDVDVDLDADEK
jgi:glycine cleavage system regulatory protein